MNTLWEIPQYVLLLLAHVCSCTALWPEVVTDISVWWVKTQIVRFTKCIVEVKDKAHVLWGEPSFDRYGFPCELRAGCMWLLTRLWIITVNRPHCFVKMLEGLYLYFVKDSVNMTHSCQYWLFSWPGSAYSKLNIDSTVLKLVKYVLSQKAPYLTELYRLSSPVIIIIRSPTEILWIHGSTDVHRGRETTVHYSVAVPQSESMPIDWVIFKWNGVSVWRLACVLRLPWSLQTQTNYCFECLGPDTAGDTVQQSSVYAGCQALPAAPTTSPQASFSCLNLIYVTLPSLTFGRVLRYCDNIFERQWLLLLAWRIISESRVTQRLRTSVSSQSTRPSQPSRWIG